MIIINKKKTCCNNINKHSFCNISINKCLHCNNNLNKSKDIIKEDNNIFCNYKCLMDYYNEIICSAR